MRGLLAWAMILTAAGQSGPCSAEGTVRVDGSVPVQGGPR